MPFSVFWDFGKLWDLWRSGGNFGRLWGDFGEASGDSGRERERKTESATVGEILGELWEALERLWKDEGREREPERPLAGPTEGERSKLY